MTKNPKSRRSLRVMKVEHKRARLQSEAFQSLIIENKATEPYAMAYDQDLLDKYRTLWQSGEWESLVTLDSDILEHHPDRAKLALIIASAWQQLNDLIVARGFIKKAKDWGCDKKLIAQIVIAGVHNTLGRVASLNGDEVRAMTHFRDAVKGVSGDAKLASQARAQTAFMRLAASNQQIKLHNDSSNSSIVSPVPSAYEGIVSYAQNFEDVMLWRALHNVKNGFYIDVGAQDPIVDSVSKAFYENGWRGIHVEPTPHYAELLRKDRPDEVVLEVALYSDKNAIEYFEIPETGISTGVSSIAQSHQQKGFQIHPIIVPCLTLADVFSKAAGRGIHWLKIDVEGMEASVLTSWGESTIRPWIVVVESTLPLTQIDTHQNWESDLLIRGYEHVYFDGLNRFYIHSEHKELKTAFLSSPNVFDSFVLSDNSSHIKK